MGLKDEAKEERKRLYFDLICGTISAILAIVGILFFAIAYGITNRTGFLTGLIFWISYLILSVFLIGVGLYTKHQERKYGIYIKKKKKKEIKPPRVG
ncbi:MAG: phage holin family protein [Promethearchaeota archaeon]